MMKIALVNYNHHDKVLGGVESRYRLLQRALESAGHQCVPISTEFQVFEEIALLTDDVSLMICDSAVGMALPVPTISIFGNPWQAVRSLGPNDNMDRAVARECRWHRKFNSVRVAVSNFMQQEMMKTGIHCDVILPNPADFSRFTEKPEPYYPPTILWIGPEIAVKNPEMFWAAKELMAKDDVQWIVSSRDSDRRKNHEQMTEIISRCTVVACTSWFEGCSNTLMEAIAAGIPVVTSRSGFFWDFWDRRFGERVENLHSPRRFVNAIRTVLQDVSAYDPRAAALEARIDYESWASSWKELVLEVVDCGRRR